MLRAELEPPRAERRRIMNAKVEREISDIIDDLTGFVAEVRREHGTDEAGQFLNRLQSRISQMIDDEANGEFEWTA
jgi:hypothetical protein